MLFDVADELPVVEKFCYRSGKDYSGVIKTPEVKHGLCRAFLEIQASRKTQLDFAKLHKLVPSRFCRWMQVFKKKGGRPDRAEMTTIANNADKLINQMKLEGSITESFMDDCNLPNATTKVTRNVPKDQRPLHNQRAVVMNSKSCMIAYQERKAKAKRAAEEAVEKREAKADKKRKREEEALEKAAKKAALEALTPAQQHYAKVRQNLGRYCKRKSNAN